MHGVLLQPWRPAGPAKRDRAVPSRLTRPQRRPTYRLGCPPKAQPPCRACSRREPMGWSIKLFDVGPTAVRIHMTFFLLLAWIGAVNWARGGAAAAVDGIIFIVLLFASVVLHEFGHVLAARRYNIKTPEITLLPIGGVASLERMPEKPGQEIVVALAGPLVTLLIVVVLIVVLGARFDLSQMAQLEQAQTTMTGRLAAANGALLLFNLIPAFPMDGGRVLRAVLAIPMGYTRATRIRSEERRVGKECRARWSPDH